MADSFAQEPSGPDGLKQLQDVAKKPKKYASFEKMPEVDLRAAELAADLDILHLEKIKNVSGQETIRILKHLQVIEAVLCDPTETVSLGLVINHKRFSFTII